MSYFIVGDRYQGAIWCSACLCASTRGRPLSAYALAVRVVRHRYAPTRRRYPPMLASCGRCGTEAGLGRTAGFERGEGSSRAS
eukprot:3173218-Rhodomonas_salina.2